MDATTPTGNRLARNFSEETRTEEVHRIDSLPPSS